MKEFFKINTEGKILGEERFTTENGINVRLVYLDNLELPGEMEGTQPTEGKVEDDYEEPQSSTHGIQVSYGYNVDLSHMFKKVE